MSPFLFFYLVIEVVVLSIITRNALFRVGKELFKRVLDSSLQVPYKSIIVVSDSDDDTDAFVKQWCDLNGKELILTRSKLYGYSKPTRALARQTAIDVFFESFSDEWLMFLDDDCVLNPGWWEWVLQNRVLEDPTVGEVWGINWDATPEREKFLKLFGIDLKSYLIRKFEERGGCHDTLFRRKAVEGVKIPPELNVYEDAYLHFHVRCRGFRSVVNPVGVTHYHPTEVNMRAELEKAKLAIQVALRYGIVEYEHVKIIHESLNNKLLAYLSLLRPIAGFIPMLLVTTRVYGFRKGFVEAFKRQYLKLWFRWQVLKNVKNVIPDVCRAIAH
jgi:glycosyltransferase involved in cell wall biosynthesis